VSATENVHAAVELMRLRRRHEDLYRRRERLQETVGHYPNAVNLQRLAALVAEQQVMESRIAELEAI
jgi:hypothetical protein